MTSTVCRTTCASIPQSITTRNAIRGHYSVFGEHSFVEGCPLLKTVYVGEYCHVMGSTLSNCTLLSSEDNKSE